MRARGKSVARSRARLSVEDQERSVTFRGRPVTPTVFSPTGIRFENIDKRYGGLFSLRRRPPEISPGEGGGFAGGTRSANNTPLRSSAGVAARSAVTV